MLSKLLIFCSLFLLLLSVQGLTQFECRYAIGKYRNCTCGVQYRIVEKRCCSQEECLLPELSSENFTCDFECQNGGNFDSEQSICNCKGGHHGVCCETETPYCGDIYVNHTGLIYSPNYPNPYPNNANCIWKISTDPNRRIALGLHSTFEVEPGHNIYSCNYDYIKVYDGLTDRGQCLGTFCGNSHFRRYFQTVYSLSSHLFVQFSSDFIVSRKGFILEYSTFFKGQECGPKTSYRRTKGTITSPQHPLPYKPNTHCQYTIQILPGHNLLLNFQLIDIKATMDCRYGDYLIASGRERNGKLKHLNAFCGNRLPRPFIVQAQRKGFTHVVLTMKSDRALEGRGFILNYRQIQHGLHNQNSTHYNSPAPST